VRQCDRAREVGEEDEARLEERDEDQVRAGVIARDLASELLDPPCELVGPDEDGAGVRLGAQEARSRP
jgi:hypothetical protein